MLTNPFLNVLILKINGSFFTFFSYWNVCIEILNLGTGDQKKIWNKNFGARN